MLNPTSPFGASSGLEALFPNCPHPQCPFGERFTSPLPLSVVLSCPPGDLGGPPLAPQSPSRSNPKIHQFFKRFLKPFWQHFDSQNESQNGSKSTQNRSQNESFQKYVNFCKIAPRLHQTLTFEAPASQKPSKNVPQNHSKIKHFF